MPPSLPARKEWHERLLNQYDRHTPVPDLQWNGRQSGRHVAPLPEVQRREAGAGYTAEADREAVLMGAFSAREEAQTWGPDHPSYDEMGQ